MDFEKNGSVAQKCNFLKQKIGFLWLIAKKCYDYAFPVHQRRIFSLGFKTVYRMYVYYQWENINPSYNTFISKLKPKIGQSLRKSLFLNPHFKTFLHSIRYDLT